MRHSALRKLPRLTLLAAPLLLAGCMYYPLGSDDPGYNDGGFYGGASVGGGYYGAGPGYYGGGSGWYDDYYYPGNGYYVYDRAGRRHEMRDKDRARWIERREERADRREDRAERRQERAERRANATPEQRAQWEARREQRRVTREDRQDARRDTGVFNREARQAIRNAVRSRGAATGDTPVRDN
jgi:hypothetical protein